MAATIAACVRSERDLQPAPEPDTDAGARDASHTSFETINLANEPQRSGDPGRGYRALLNNAGHDSGEALSDDQRCAVLEYLKTI